MQISMDEAERQSLLDDWYRQFNVRLVDFLYRGVRIRADAQDLAQEIYLRMLRVKNPELIESPPAYLYRVAIHVLDEWRTRERRTKLHSSDGLEELIDPADAYSGSSLSDLKVDIRNALSQLPAIHSATLIMHWHHGMTYSEIADHLQVSERQVKRYVVKGYAALRCRLGSAWGFTHD